MYNLLWIAAGGALGAVLRFLMTWGSHTVFPGFRPLGTMLVNVLGCLLVGMLMSWIMHSKTIGSPLHLFLVPGLLGGFTTFSAFGYETVTLWQEKHANLAVLNLAGSVGLGLCAVVLGQCLMERFLR